MENYVLIDGELRNAQHPDSFEIPDRDARTSVTTGTYVKVGFEYVNRADVEINGERMWVQVRDHDPITGMYTGTLANEPVEDVLSLDDEVQFMPQHILSIHED